jgi:phage-related protein
MHVVIGDSKFWHRLALGAASATLALALTPVLNAQSSGQSSTQPASQKSQAADQDTKRTELRNFDGFLDKHQEIREDLKKNPSLVNSDEYVENHPELAEFLKSHPGVREEIKENPKAFLAREHRYEQHEGERGRGDSDVTRTELRNFDGFLDKHQEVREDLKKNPSLVDNEEYLENHAELRDFLKDYPGVRKELKEHPKAFIARERRYEQKEDSESAKKEKQRRPDR